MSFEDFLIKLRRAYSDNLLKNSLILFGIFIGFSVVGIISDIYLHGNSWITIIKSFFIMGPIAFSSFCLGYFLSIFLIDYGKANEVPFLINYRKEFSPKWRRNISLMITAAGFIFLYMNYNTPYATISSGLFLALLLGLIVFTRLTSDESEREKLGVPDKRDSDVEFVTHKMRMERKRKAQEIEQERELKKSRKKSRNFLNRLNRKSGEESKADERDTESG